MSPNEIFRFSSQYFAGKSANTFDVVVFEDHFLYSFSQSFLTIVSGLIIPFASIRKIAWDSREKITLDWMDANGQFQQTIVMGRAPMLERFVEYIRTINQRVEIDVANKMRVLRAERELLLFMGIFLGIMIFMAAIIWGARYLGLISY